jgi:hypothetical protein
MSSTKSWPLAWLAPVLQRVLPLSSSAFDGGSPEALAEAVPVHPVRARTAAVGADEATVYIVSSAIDHQLLEGAVSAILT